MEEEFVNACKYFWRNGPGGRRGRILRCAQNDTAALRMKLQEYELQSVRLHGIIYLFRNG